MIQRAHFNRFQGTTRSGASGPPTTWRLRIAHMYDLSADTNRHSKHQFFGRKMYGLMVHDGSGL